MRKRRLRLVALMLLGLSLMACGKKGPPVAPERRLPMAATGLQAFIDGDSIVLTWNNPGTRFDGTRLRDLTTLKLHRREEAEGIPPKPALLSAGGVVGYNQIASIALESPAPAAVQGSQVRWVDRQGLTLGRRYVYVVTALDSSGRSSPPSERLEITLLAGPKPPSSVVAQPGDSGVSLRWDPPTEFTDGTPVSGEVRYVVLRGSGGEGELVLITPQPLTATSYTDTGLQNENEYRYAVRAVRVDLRAVVRGAPSAVVTAIPTHTTPPRPPTSLVAIPSPGALRLAWNRSPQEDVAVYAVYRAVGPGEFVRIATTPATNTSFVDRDVQPGITYRYVVTAIDRARRPNESARSNEVTIRIP